LLALLRSIQVLEEQHQLMSSFISKNEFFRMIIKLWLEFSFEELECEQLLITQRFSKVIQNLSFQSLCPQMVCM
ncbi:hypothetical protein A2U01_0042444, partial [Trifolium medium]|nr:hypothetical protein [Trifolium medium]